MASFCQSRSQRSTPTALVAATLLAVGVVLSSFAVRAGPRAVPPRPEAAGARAPDGKHTARVTISNFAFSPAIVIVPAGTELVWTNEDDAPHTVRGIDGDSPIVSQPLDTGDSYSVVVERPGTYKYFCTLHPVMVGTVIVQ